MTVTEAFEQISGYRYLGLTKNHLWGKWIPDDASCDNSNQWRRVLVQRQRRNAKQAKQRRANCLSPDNRDRHYRRLLNCLTLHPADRADLHRRGLTDTQIEVLGFKSVGQWHPLTEAFPETLPGLLRGGRSLNVFSPGYLCPIRDTDGLIVACQVRSREGSPKYYWLTSATKNNPYGQAPNLANGELPLPVFYPEQPSTEAIAIVEGTGAKPAIASHRLTLVTIGAGGSNWASSPENLKATLAKLSAELGTKTIRFYPDAGMLDDAHRTVRHQYKRLWELLEQWGHTVLVMWWGQISKADGDIDELEDLGRVKPITPAEFWAIAGIETTCQQSQYQDDAISEPDPEEYRRHQAQVEEWETVEAIAAAHYRTGPNERYQKEVERVMQRLCGLDVQPTLSLTGRYIPAEAIRLPERSGIVGIDAPMGRGKTATAFKELSDQHRSKYPEAFQCLITPTNALGRQSANKLKLPHHTTFKGFGKPPQYVTFCPPSAWRFPVRSLPQGQPPLIFIDEPSGLFEQILDGDTCGDKHALILCWLRSLLRWVKKQGGWVVIAEDGLSNCEFDLLKEAAGLEVVEFIQFTPDSHPERELTLFEGRSMLDFELKKRLFCGDNLILASDSKKWLENAKDKAIALGISEDEIWILTSDNSSEEWAQEFTEAPDEWLKKHKPRLFGFSPACVSGVSIDDPDGHFDALGFCLVHLAPGQAKQLPERLRTNVPRFGYVKEKGSILDPIFSAAHPDIIVRDFYRNVKGIEKLTDFAKYALDKSPTDADGNLLDLVGAIANIKESESDPSSDFGFWLKWFANYRAKAAYTRTTLRESLIELWKTRNYQIGMIEGRSKAESAESALLRKQGERDEAQAFTERDTSKLSVSDARQILEDGNATASDRKVAEKRILQDKLPTCDLDNPEFVYKAIVKDDSKFLRAVELLWLSRNPDAAKWLDRWRWASEANTAVRRGTSVSYARLSYRSGKAKLFNECPLQPFIDGTITQWDNNTPEAIAVHEWALLRRHQFRRYLNIQIFAEHTPVKTVNKLLRKLSLEIEHFGWKGSRQDRERQYRCTNLEDADRDAILESLELKISQRLKAKEGIEETTFQQPVIATRIDTSLSTSCDHALLQVAELPPDCGPDLADMWAIATTEVEKEVILAIYQTTREAIAS